MANYDVTLLTQKEYINLGKVDGYLQNVLLEDQLITSAIEKLNLVVNRVAWDDDDFNWQETQSVLIRGIWDYFKRFDEFKPTFQHITTNTKTINSPDLVWWNIDKHYLKDLAEQDINIVPSIFIEPESEQSLTEAYKSSRLSKAVVKPAISGTARHTYVVDRQSLDTVENKIAYIMKQECFLLQPFVDSIPTRGEVSHMVFDGIYTHSVLKKAKKGDFRVQDDFGGTVHDYNASVKEIAFAQKVVEACKSKPLYARVDVVWDQNDELALAELEIIEPELWFRKNHSAADVLAQAIAREIRL